MGRLKIGCNWVLVEVTTTSTISVEVIFTNPYACGEGIGANSLT